MSESDLYEYEELFEEKKPDSGKKLLKKRVSFNRSDSDETVALKDVKKRKPSAPKKSAKTKEAQGVFDAFDLFGLVTVEESAAAAQRSESPGKLPSVLNTRVENGIVSHRKSVNGEFYVEVKVYRTSDAASTRPEERWRKALTSLKIQMNTDGDEWKQLQDFFKTIRKSMNDVEPVFLGNRTN